MGIARSTGLDVWLFFEVVLPWKSGAAVLEVRHRVMLDRMRRQINTITIAAEDARASLRFGGQDQGWQPVDLPPLRDWWEGHAPRAGRVVAVGAGPLRRVLIPDLGRDERGFEPLREALAGRPERTLIVVPPGTGGTPAPPATRGGYRDGWWTEWIVRSVVDLVRSESLPAPVALGGVGFGAAIAARAAVALGPSAAGAVACNGWPVRAVDGAFDADAADRRRAVRALGRRPSRYAQEWVIARTFEPREGTAPPLRLLTTERTPWDQIRYPALTHVVDARAVTSGGEAASDAFLEQLDAILPA